MDEAKFNKRRWKVKFCFNLIIVNNPGLSSGVIDYEMFVGF